MWKIWLDIEKELATRKPFNPIGYVLANQAQAAKLLAPIPQLNLPPNAPQPVIQQAIQQLLQVGIVEIDPVECVLTVSVMESKRMAKREMIRGKILACRTPDLKVQANLLIQSAGWEPVPIPN